MSETNFNNEDYTVGWICPLEVELAAASGMLDVEHPDLPCASHDTNIYTLGSIGQHNIVLAALPAGTTGNNVAATVAINLLRTFPNIRFGLLVGIGGGAPSNPSNDPRGDLRLGDVVVSNPDGEFGATAAYQDYQYITHGCCRWRDTIRFW